MIIGVDYTAAMRQGAGIGRYTRELIGRVAALAPEHQFVLFFPARDLPSPALQRAAHELAARQPNVRLVELPFSARLLTILWQRLRLPLFVELFTGQLDLLHGPDFVLPPTRARTIVTIHDLTFLIRPDCAEPKLVRYLSQAVPRSLKRADHVLVDSLATKHDIERLLAAPPAKLQVLYPGVSEAFRPLPPHELAAVRSRLSLPERFVLFLATIEPRKNVIGLIEGFLMYCNGQADRDLQLLIGGRMGWRTEAIEAKLREPAVQARVKRLDFVADEDLPALYNLASLFAYPSRYEGFGLPALEALACGTPVLTANLSSLPEVVGAAAITVDPEQPSAIAAGIGQALAQHEQLRQRGPTQAARFRWEAAATALLACYHDVSHGARRRP